MRPYATVVLPEIKGVITRKVTATVGYYCRGHIELKQPIFPRKKYLPDEGDNRKSSGFYFYREV